MNLNEPSAELNFAVAEAVGIPVTLSNWMLSSLSAAWVFEHEPEWDRLAGMGCQLVKQSDHSKAWCPSVDMTDAWEAAEKAGLFDQFACALWQDKGGWVVGDYEEHAPAFARAPTGPLVICKAILTSVKEPAND